MEHVGYRLQQYTLSLLQIEIEITYDIFVYRYIKRTLHNSFFVKTYCNEELWKNHSLKLLGPIFHPINNTLQILIRHCSRRTFGHVFISCSRINGTGFFPNLLNQQTIKV